MLYSAEIFFFGFSLNTSIILVALMFMTPVCIYLWLRFGHEVFKPKRSYLHQSPNVIAEQDKLPDINTLSREEILEKTAEFLEQENLLLAEEYLYFINKNFQDKDVVQDALYRLIEVTYLLEKYSLTVDHANRYIARYGEHPEISTYIGKCYLSLGNLPEAEELFQNLLKKYPDLIDALFGMAQVHRKLGNHDRAREIQQEIFAIEQKNKLAF